MEASWELEKGEAGYPADWLDCLGTDAPPRLTGLGDRALLGQGGIALVSSRRCPGAIASRMFDLAQRIRDRGRPALGGFHSPMEKECLRILLHSPHPIVIGLARDVTGARIPRSWQRPLREGRLLLLSATTDRRTTAAGARARNLLLTALADEVLVAHAEPAGATAELCRQVAAWGKPLRCPDAGDPAFLAGLGARAVGSEWPARPGMDPG